MHKFKTLPTTCPLRSRCGRPKPHKPKKPRWPKPGQPPDFDEEDAEISKAQAGKALDSFFSGVQSFAMKKKERRPGERRLSGLGDAPDPPRGPGDPFNGIDISSMVGGTAGATMRKSARKGRNPQTGQQSVYVPETSATKIKIFCWLFPRARRCCLWTHCPFPDGLYGTSLDAFPTGNGVEDPRGPGDPFNGIDITGAKKKEAEVF